MKPHCCQSHSCPGYKRASTLRSSNRARDNSVEAEASNHTTLSLPLSHLLSLFLTPSYTLALSPSLPPPPPPHTHTHTPTPPHSPEKKKKSESPNISTAAMETRRIEKNTERSVEHIYAFLALIGFNWMPWEASLSH